jgi:hypothetical protein
MNEAGCLCGQVTWQLDGPLEWMSHCHCSRCRKAHGSAFATYVAGDAKAFQLRGAEHVVRWESSPGFFRCFCRSCGSVVPGDAFENRIFVPAGNFQNDPGHRPLMHIFVASKAPWLEIGDSLPRYDGYPPGFDAPEIADRGPVDPPGAVRGSCLCGAIAYVVEGKPLRCVNCHCSRCRKARSAAYASNLVTAADGVRFTRGENHRSVYKIAEARFFTHVFCKICGSSVPRIDLERSIAIVPMGSLDDDPGIRPQFHIFVGSKAPWDEISDDLPQHGEAAPSR